MRERLRPRSAVLGLACICVLGVGTVTTEEPAKAEVPPIHQVDELEEAVLDAILAFLREDQAGALDAIRRVGTYSRPLKRGPDDDRYSREVVNYDQAFHIVVGHSREFAEQGDLKNSFNQFVWVQRTCVECHDLSRREGVLPDDGKPLRSAER